MNLRSALCLVVCLLVAEGVAGATHRSEDMTSCTPGDPTTCPAGHCCVKEGLSYIPEYTGPRPAYRISCKALGKQGSPCFVNNKYPDLCPCATGLTCRSGTLGFFGHCH